MKKRNKIIIGSLAGVTTCAATVYGACTLIDEVLFNRKLTPPPEVGAKISGCDMSHLGDLLMTNLKWLEHYGYEKHYITSDRGERLTGYLMRAKEPSDIYVFGAHGYRSYGKKEFCGFAQYYLSRGINVFFPDHIASGESQGNFCSFGYYEKQDCIKWLGYMKETFGEDIKLILHGVSMGSATVCMMSDREDLPENVKFIVADCGFTTAKALFESKLKAMGVPPKALIGCVDFAHRLNHGFSFGDISPVNSVAKARVPMLFVHGDKDGLVPCYMAKELYDACGNEKELFIAENADHAQSHVYAKEEYEKTIDSFIEKYI